MKKVLTAVATTLSGLLLVTGCSQNPTANNGQEDYSLIASYENNSGEDVVKDVAHIAESFNFTQISLGAPKMQASTDITWQVWNYTGNWWTRSGKIAVSVDQGSLDIGGVDSVKFLDANNTAVKNPLLSTVTGGVIKYHGSFDLSGTNGGFVRGSRNYSLSGSIANGTTLTLNGTLNQKFSAQDSSATRFCNLEGTATASNIVYTKGLLGWSKPVSGIITVQSSFKTITVTFTNGVAAILVKAKDGTVVKSVNVTL